jgi:hypothetical protein
LATAAAAFSPTVIHHASSPVQYYNNNRLQKNNILLPATQREDDEPSSVVRERIKNGNYLDLLQISVVIFFLFTLWASGDSILSDYSSNTLNNPEYNNGSGKSRIYKYVDADKLLRDEFEREESKVIFD